MNKKETQLKKDVMQRVHSIYYMRTVVRPLVVELGLFVASIVAVSFLVSVPNVIINAVHYQTAGKCFAYLFNALLHTKLTVQIILLSALILLGLLAKEIFSNFSWSRKTYSTA
jgi:hypothetical protein